VRRILSHFSVFARERTFWELDARARAEEHDRLRAGLREAADAVHTYLTFGTRSNGDFIVWSSLDASDPEAPAGFFQRFSRAVEPFRRHLRLAHGRVRVLERSGRAGDRQPETPATTLSDRVPVRQDTRVVPDARERASTHDERAYPSGSRAR